MNVLEIIAAVLGVISVGFVIQRNVWAFPVGFVMVLLYAVVFFQARLYSDVLLQFFFAAMQLHGWWAWRRNMFQQKIRNQPATVAPKIEIRTLSMRQWWLTGVVLLTGTAALGFVMQRYTDAAAPYTDAYVAVLSVLAQLWMNTRYLENWMLWMGVNQVAIFLYASRELYFTVALYAIFLTMAVAGYLNWRAKLHTQGEQNSVKLT